MKSSPPPFDLPRLRSRLSILETPSMSFNSESQWSLPSPGGEVFGQSTKGEYLTSCRARRRHWLSSNTSQLITTPQLVRFIVPVVSRFPRWKMKISYVVFRQHGDAK